MVRAVLEHGPCKSLLAPDSWLRVDEHRDGASWLSKFVPPNDTDNTLLGIFDRGIPINDASMLSFNKLLHEAHSTTSERKLQSDEIKSLAQVMGVTSVGDNQFTNTNKYPDPRSPVFFLEQACFIKIQGRTVLEVKGKFLNQKGTVINFFRGIFIPSQIVPNKVQEVFLQTNSESEFKKSEEIYRNALESIAW